MNDYFKPLRRKIGWKPVIVGFGIGTVVTAFFFINVCMLRERGDRLLIGEWRKVRYGMPLSEVENLLGKPNGRFPSGEKFRQWANEVPDDFYKTHGLVTYVIPGIGPHVLLIYIDEENRVVFVSSHPT